MAGTAAGAPPPPWNSAISKEPQLRCRKQRASFVALREAAVRQRDEVNRVTSVTNNIRLLMPAVFASAVIAAIAACDILNPGPSGPGELRANIVSPNANDGAAVLELTGGAGLGLVTTDNGEAFYQHDGATTRVVVVLENPGLITFMVRVEDVAALPSVTVLQVADGNNELRTSVSGYDVEWVRLADSDLRLQRRGQ